MEPYYGGEEEHIPRRRRRVRQQAPKKRRKSPLQKFFIILLSVAAIYVVALGAFALRAYISPDPNDKPMDLMSEAVGLKVPERTSFVIMCTDEDGTRTDTIMVGCFNTVTNSLDLISIPRDTMVTVSEENYNKMCEEYPDPNSNEMQINHVHHFAGDTDGPKMLTEELERLLGVKFDYYVRVNFDAFHYFVDSVGGVEFDVPMDMDYDDPTQDLAIHLNEGVQVLDGEKAEQLVRYRKDNYGHGYANGDIGRIDMQQQFLKALMKKAADTDTIKSNPSAYINTFFKYVTTNATAADALKYASALKKFNADNVHTYTLPGEAGAKYYYDEDETQKLVYDIFKRAADEAPASDTVGGSDDAESEKLSAKQARIQVLNGGYTNGKAGEVQEKLNADGYNVENIDNFNDSVKKAETRIYVSGNYDVEELAAYFKDAKVTEDSSLTGDYDIVIIIGTEEE